MPAKKTRRPSLETDFAALVKLNERAFACGRRAIELEQAGKRREAGKAKRQAKEWLRKTMEIEARYPPLTRDEYLRRRAQDLLNRKH